MIWSRSGFLNPKQKPCVGGYTWFMDRPTRLPETSLEKNMHSDTLKHWVRKISLAEVVSWFRNVPTMSYVCCWYTLRFGKQDFQIPFRLRKTCTQSWRCCCLCMDPCKFCNRKYGVNSWRPFPKEVLMFECVPCAVALVVALFYYLHFVFGGLWCTHFRHIDGTPKRFRCA